MTYILSYLNYVFPTSSPYMMSSPYSVVVVMFRISQKAPLSQGLTLCHYTPFQIHSSKPSWCSQLQVHVEVVKWDNFRYEVGKLRGIMWDHTASDELGREQC